MNDYNIFSIKDKIIVIVGATGILGTEYCKHLSRLGAKVVVGDLIFEDCKKLCREIKDEGFEAFPIQIDLTSESKIKNFFKKIYKKFGKIDVLINNAQIKPKNFYNSFEKYDKKTMIEVLDGNLLGVILCCQEAIKLFLRNKNNGVIVNIASIYGLLGPDQRIYKGVKNIYNNDDSFSSPVSYAVSKAGIIQLTKYLASYYREKNIRINCLTIGGVFDNHDDAFNNNYSKRTTLGRMANRNEYNGSIVFLCSDASSYMSGSNLIIDGGWSAI